LSAGRGQPNLESPVPDLPPPGEWLTYKAAADRLGLQPSAVAARARRARWPKRLRNDTGEAEILVPGELLATPRQRPQEGRPAPAPDSEAPKVAAAVQAAVGPLQAALERETMDRRTLQGQADALRDQLAAAQLDAARAAGKAATEAARREGAEREAADLRRQLEALQARPRRRWWWP
jgi:hypothetical protein